LKLMNENLLCCTCVRRRQQMHGLRPLNVIKQNIQIIEIISSHLIPIQLSKFKFFINIFVGYANLISNMCALYRKLLLSQT